MQRYFDIKQEELSNLHEIMDPNNMQKLEKIGGVKGLSECLKVDPSEGLPLKETQNRCFERKAHFGENVYHGTPVSSFFSLFKETFDDPTLKILIASAIISLLLGMFIGDPETGWIEGTAILIAVLIVSFVTAINDYQKEKQFQQLNELKNLTPVTVLRQLQKKNGEIGSALSQIPIEEIVVGDIIYIASGSKIPADGIIISSSQLQIDESTFLGESQLIRKDKNKNPFLYTGTQVQQGEGTYIATAVGQNSQYGKIYHQLKESSHLKEKTPLQDKLEIMAELIGKMGLYSAILTVIFLLIQLFIKNWGNGWDSSYIVNIVDSVIIGITIVVVAVPEGLPLAVTISLAYSMKKMMRDNNFVRRLESCETMGNATCICSDKTGTLTQNQMNIVKGMIFGENHSKMPDSTEILGKWRDKLIEGIALNTRAFVQQYRSNLTQIVGSQTEAGLIRLLIDWGVDFEHIRKKYQNTITDVYTFDSIRKRMTTIHKVDDSYCIYTKGAAEFILDSCTEYIDQSGEISRFDENTKNNYRKIIQSIASEGLRVIALSFKLSYQDQNFKINSKEENESNHILLAIFGMIDRVRPGVTEAVNDALRAGVEIKMVTGDGLETAKHVALECGILRNGGLIMSGFEFRKLQHEEKKKIIPNLQVLARSSPQDKYELVSILQEMGEIVGVTGDGTNDALALRKADVGLSMGISGTNIAQEASDIIILDDNFKSIVVSIIWGRSVYDNIRKFLQFQLTVNVVALVTSFLAAVSGKGIPLKAVQLLWINLIMDTLAALALGTEPPSKSLLNRNPYKRSSSLLSNKMKRNIACQSIFQLFVLLYIIVAGPKIFNLDVSLEDERYHLECIVFNVFVMLQVFNEINCRKIEDQHDIFEGITKNKIFLYIIIGIFITQILIIEFGGSFFSTTHLNAKEWFYSIFFGLMSIPIGFLSKKIKINTNE
ncbi:cation transporting atpase [Anaeramoeba flamelloides]|uniref:Calcium-transporting ATPase n=1 Tax=Anaeramoeba flamelloides TaxID=1746091 RepID=A0ABQ8YAP2_9EUKA|nr:cation transporting atpase [Anaeramoeba flamelloides]